jgi:hypothetical protein
MTDQEIKIKVAECVGWTETIEFIHRGRREQRANPMPPYHLSIDTIRAEVLKQSEEFQAQFDEAMLMLKVTKYRNHEQQFRFHQLTATDWCHCFLEAWEKISVKQQTKT